MKKYVLLGLALIFANSVTAARADSCTSYATIRNASGSPPVVAGSAVQLQVTITPGSVVPVYLDGKEVFTVSNPNSTSTTITTTATVPSGSHSLQAGTCVTEFSSVSPPGTPTLSSSRAVVSNGLPYTISWTVPSGSIDHYTLSLVVNGGAPATSVLPASTTSKTFSSSTKAGVDNTHDFMVRACSSADESICSSWSNTVEVDIINGS